MGLTLIDDGDVTLAASGNDLAVSWQSALPAGTWFQVYQDHRLAWSGQQRSAILPYPSAFVQIDVGSVSGLTEGYSDFSSSLPSVPARRASLTFLGGTYLDASGGDDVAGFRIYRATIPGGSVDYTKAVADVPAYPGGIIQDGWGMGGWGQGGWGKSASKYTWVSEPLGSGTWRFGVKSYDGAGNEVATLAELDAVIDSPPRPPARFADGTRLRYSFNPMTSKITLTWNASP